jgi:hypothetical protein
MGEWERKTIRKYFDENEERMRKSWLLGKGGRK